MRRRSTNLSYLKIFIATFLSEVDAKLKQTSTTLKNNSQESPQIISKTFNVRLCHELTYYLFKDYFYVTFLSFRDPERNLNHFSSVRSFATNVLDLLKY